MTCTSCGADVDQVHAIRRKYVTAAGSDQEPTERIVDEIEHWCFACLTHYPHEIVPRYHVEDHEGPDEEGDVGGESGEQ